MKYDGPINKIIDVERELSPPRPIISNWHERAILHWQRCWLWSQIQKSPYELPAAFLSMFSEGSKFICLVIWKLFIPTFVNFVYEEVFFQIFPNIKNYISELCFDGVFHKTCHAPVQKAKLSAIRLLDTIAREHGYVNTRCTHSSKL